MEFFTLWPPLPQERTSPEAEGFQETIRAWRRRSPCREKGPGP